jgi:hypothetical protein
LPITTKYVKISDVNDKEIDLHPRPAWLDRVPIIYAAVEPTPGAIL